MGRDALRRVAAVALGGLLAAAPSASAAGWSAPEELTGAAALQPRVVSAPNGDAVIVWGHRGDDPSRGGERVAFASASPGAGFGPVAPIAASAGGVLSDLASNARGQASATWSGGQVNNQPTPYGTAARSPGEGFGAAVPLSFGEGVGVAEGKGLSAMDRAGNTTWQWVDPDSGQGRLMTRFADGSFGPARDAPWTRTGGARAIAADGDGNLVVAWVGKLAEEEGNRVFVTSAPPGGEFDPPRPVSEQFGNYDLLAFPKLRLAANDRGDFVVAWSAVPRADPPPGTIRSDAVIHMSVRPRGGDFGPDEAVPAHSGRMTRIQDWDLAVSATGDALAAWTDVGQIALAYRPAGGPIERARRIDTEDDDHDHGAPSVAFDGRGGALVLWQERPAQHHQQIRALHRPPGGEYGPALVVDDAPHLYDPDVAADADGDAVAAWARQTRFVHDSRESGLRAAVFDPSMPALRSLEAAPAGLSFKASAATRVVARFDRRVGKSWKRVGKATARARRGRNRIELGGKLARRLRAAGRYRVTLSAPLDGGLETRPRVAEFRVR